MSWTLAREVKKAKPPRYRGIPRKIFFSRGSVLASVQEPLPVQRCEPATPRPRS